MGGRTSKNLKEKAKREEELAEERAKQAEKLGIVQQHVLNKARQLYCRTISPYVRQTTTCNRSQAIVQ